ncbi:MAG: hypothetical protein Q9209_001276 [Squamulea sp. 1 TL-2023]
MDAGADIGGFMSKLDKNLNRTALLSTMPWTAHTLKHNSIVGYFVKDSTMFPSWATQQIQERIVKRQHTAGGPGSLKEETTDFLDSFLKAAKRDDPPGYDFFYLLDWTLVNVMAGADTTAIGLRAVLYFLLKAPSKLTRLLDKIRKAHLSVPVSWK